MVFAVIPPPWSLISRRRRRCLRASEFSLSRCQNAVDISGSLERYGTRAVSTSDAGGRSGLNLHSALEIPSGSLIRALLFPRDTSHSSSSGGLTDTRAFRIVPRHFPSTLLASASAGARIHLLDFQGALGSFATFRFLPALFAPAVRASSRPGAAALSLSCSKRVESWRSASSALLAPVDIYECG